MKYLPCSESFPLQGVSYKNKKQKTKHKWVIDQACSVNFNYLITESEVVTGKSQTEALPYWPSDSEVNTIGRGLRFSRNDRTVEVIKLFIIWLTVWIKEK